MRVQNINQSSIYSQNSRQNGSAGFSEGCKPRPHFLESRKSEFNMPSFKGVLHKTLQQAIDDSFKRKLANKSAEFSANIIQPKTLLQELESLTVKTYKAVKESYNKSNTKKLVIAPIMKKWGDFTSPIKKQWAKFENSAPRFSQMVKGAGATTVAVTGFDITTGI